MPKILKPKNILKNIYSYTQTVSQVLHSVRVLDLTLLILKTLSERFLHLFKKLICKLISEVKHSMMKN